MLTRNRTAVIEVWEPKYSTNEVLVAVYKVKDKNKIKITKGAYKGTYEMSGIAARSYPVISNGRIPCFALPISKLRRIK